MWGAEEQVDTIEDKERGWDERLLIRQLYQPFYNAPCGAFLNNTTLARRILFIKGMYSNLSLGSLIHEWYRQAHYLKAAQ
jgi:hypothetical protein